MRTIRPGQLVYFRNDPATVLELRGLTDVVLRMMDNGNTTIARATDLTLSPIDTENVAHAKHLLAQDSEWDLAMERFELIKPLLTDGRGDLDEVKKIAIDAGKSPTTVYRWLKRYRETGLVSSLLRAPRSDLGTQKLHPEVEEIISIKIGEYFLQKERPSVKKLAKQVALACRMADLEPPHKNTIYARVRQISEKEQVRKRISPKKAREQFEPIRGSFPGGDYPNAVGQIDHTPMDLIVVDDEHRLPIGRPYLTIAIDVATKMMNGFCMSLEAPGASNVGLCISHAVLKKDLWLAQHDISAEWPIYGKMQKIHVDNAKEFRGTMVERGCEQHGIILENRPKGMPNYGPHVERAFRTYMEEVHSLPGTTFSNVAKKFDYDSDGKACMTLAELELWFTIYVVYCYHNEPHGGNDKIPPIQQYKKLVYGDKDTKGVGLPAPIEDEETFRLNFTPFVDRTIQRDGTTINYIQYYAPILRPWINVKDPTTGKGLKFIFARDPRDISVVYFMDPDLGTYHPVPYLNNTRPAISLWELKAITKELEKDPYREIDEDAIFEGIRRMREIELEAIEKTRLAKSQRATEKRKLRMVERRKRWQGVHVSKNETNDASNSVSSQYVTEPLLDDDDDIEITPFDDIEI